MSDRPNSFNAFLLPAVTFVVLMAFWFGFTALRLAPESAFPSPQSVVRAFLGDMKDGSLPRDIVASLWRVACGFLLSMVVGIPLGLGIGLSRNARLALLPAVNFFRNLSPIAWIPFAILWFGIGDVSTVFLIFLAATFPLTVSTAAAVANIPRVHFRVARDYGITGSRLLTEVILPAILPQVITSLRVTVGLSWLVLVAAEMIAGREGLGFLVWDARNGLRMDRLVSAMIVIGLIGIVLDRLLSGLTRLPSVRWGYER
ncbi:MAG: ABC transporter permease [Capsulimonadales bacterium]|nr:ABC transporter permease [Capsulimonadales bacterium]